MMMKKNSQNIGLVVLAYLFVCMRSLAGIYYWLPNAFDSSNVRESSFILDFLGFPYGFGIVWAVLVGIAIAMLKNVRFMNWGNIHIAGENLKKKGKESLEKLAVLFVITVLLMLVFDYFSNELCTVASEIFMKLTGMSYIDQLAAASNETDILFGTMTLSARLGTVLIPNTIYMVDMYVVYVIYKLMGVLFVADA